jgi:DNA-3-methyladenine glycosylase
MRRAARSRSGQDARRLAVRPGPETLPPGLAGALEPMARATLEAPAPAAAAALLGALLVREEPDGTRTIARIVETEAYREDDPASHSVRRTARTEPMFWRPGTAYVYRSYGVHWCVNVTVEGEGCGAAALLRAATLVTGHAAVRRRRPGVVSDRELLRGPGRLTAGLDLDAPRHDRGDLVTGVAGLTLATDGWRASTDLVVAGPRVGIRHAADRPWRFHLRDVPEVSDYRRSPRAGPPPPADPDTDVAVRTAPHRVGGSHSLG